MSRNWYEIIAPKYLHDEFGVYQGIWMPQMDRCWCSDDGFQVTSRIIMTNWGKVEHAAISIISQEHYLSSNGERDIPWATKQEIKNELFGKKRLAIEVFPKDKALVDVQDCYHLWIFPKEFDIQPESTLSFNGDPFLANLNLTRTTKLSDGCILKVKTEFFGDNFTTCQDGDIA